MAAPATAPTQTDLQRQSDARFNSVVDAAVEIVKIRRASRDKELTSLLGSQRGLDKAIGEGQNNAFVKLADVNNRYARIAAGGQVQPQDKLKYLIQVMELQAEIDKNGRKPNSQRVQRLLAQSGATDPSMYRDSAVSRRLWENYIAEVSEAPYDPTLLGDVQDLMAKTGWDLNTVQSLPGGEVIVDQYVTRENAATSLSAAADAIRQAFGQDALKTMGAQLAGGGVGIAAAETSMQSIPDSVYEQVREQAKKLPGLDDAIDRRAANDDRITKLRNALDEDPGVEVNAIMSGMQSANSRADAGFKNVSFKARLMGQPKFHEWAKSNGFTVGYARKADQPGDQDLPGYDSATQTVYVPGLDDDRAFRAAARQAAMGPRAQALPSFMQGVRGRLPERKNLTVEVSETSAEEEKKNEADRAKVHPDGKFRTIDGKYATEAEVKAARDAETYVESGTTKGGTPVFKTATGKIFLSSPGMDPVEVQPGDARLAGMTFTRLAAPLVASDDALGIAEAPVPPPAKTRTIVGRETALLPSDPPGATVIETTEGRRIVIPKEKVVASRDYKEDDVTSGTGAPLEGETGARGIRAPFAAARARMGGITEPEPVAAPTPQAAAVRRTVAPTVAAPAVPMRTPTRREAPPSGYGTPVAPTAVVPIPAPAVTAPAAAPKPATPTPGEEAGAEIRAAASSPMTGGNAPQPPAGTTSGTPAKVPVLADRTVGTSVTPPPPPTFAPAAQPSTTMPLPVTTTSTVPTLPAGAFAAAPAAAVPTPEEDLFPESSITLESEEVPSVEPRTDMAAMRARLDAIRRLREDRAAVAQAGILPTLPAQ